MTRIRTPRDLAEAEGSVTVSELALVVRCSERWVRKLIACRAIRFGRVGRNYRIPAEEARRVAREAGILPA